MKIFRLFIAMMLVAVMVVGMSATSWAEDPKVAQVLQGKAAGVTVVQTSGKPGSGASIRVRGYSSNSGSMDPLFVVDGVNAGQNFINPSDIESMEVLKDGTNAGVIKPVALPDGSLIIRGGEQNGFEAETGNATYTQSASTNAVTAGVVKGTWIYDAATDKWTFTSADGSIYRNEWAYIYNDYATGDQPKTVWYFFDENGIMLTGYQWILSAAGGYRLFYFHEVADGMRGSMYANASTPDGYYADGAGWIHQDAK